MKMTTWPEEELVRELWDDESPLFINDYSYSNPSSNINDPLLIVNDHQDISDSNSSPIIGGVSESALSFTSNFRINHSEDLFQARFVLSYCFKSLVMSCILYFSLMFKN